MKTDLATSILAAVVSVIIAYFACNVLLPKIDDFTVKVLSSTADYNLTEPNPEVFNFRSINPTVEVYVGQCEGDNCDSGVIIDLPEDVPEEPTDEETTDKETTEEETPAEELTEKESESADAPQKD